MAAPMSSRLASSLTTLLRTTRDISRSTLRTTGAFTRRIQSPLSLRFYATPGRPKKGSVGATSKKATTKKTAASAAKKSTTKKTTTTRKPKTEADVAKAKAKRAAAAEKKEAQRVKRQTLVAKRKAKREATTAKAKAKRTADRQKKVLAKEKAKTATPTAQIKALKVVALSPPTIQTSSAYLAFNRVYLKSHSGEKINISETSRAASAEYRNLSASEKDAYVRSGAEAREKSLAAHRDWVLAQSPETILAANQARAKLRRLKTKHKIAGAYRAIEDPRAPSPPPTAYLLFHVEQVESGTGGGKSLGESAKTIGAAWKALPESQKEQYRQRYETARAQYVKDYERLYGVAPGKRAASVEATEVAA